MDGSHRCSNHDAAGDDGCTGCRNTQSDLPQEELTVHFIDVGQGLAIMAKAGDDVLVYDGGNSDAASYFVSYLKDEGVEDIDYMIASHTYVRVI